MVEDLLNIEFTARPDGQVEVRMGHSTPFVLTQQSLQVIEPMYIKIEDDYPAAFNALCERYKESRKNYYYYRFLIVQGFIKCNFGAYDHTFDIDDKGEFHFEFTQCPMAGECKYFQVICNPKRYTKLTAQELNVLDLISKGMNTKSIAKKLCISPHTVNNHRKNIQRKLGMSKISEIVTYYNHLKNI